MLPTVIFYLMMAGGIALLFLLTSCSPRIVEKIVTEYRDTTIVKKVVRDSLIPVPIPLESGQAIVEVGDTSRLETSVAQSEAFIGKDGRLHHTLDNKSDKTLPVVVPVRELYVFNGRHEKEGIIRTKEVEVEKPLSWWRKFQIRAFWWFGVGVILLLLWTFRKQLLKLIV